MKRINHQTLNHLVKTNQDLVGLFFNKVIMLSEYDLLFELNHGKNIFVSLNNINPFIDFNVNSSLLPRNDLNTPFAKFINLNCGGKISEIKLDENDYIFSIVLEQKNDVGKSLANTIVFELISHHPNGFVLSPQNLILQIFNRTFSIKEKSRSNQLNNQYVLPVNFVLNRQEITQDLSLFETYCHDNKTLLILSIYKELVATINSNIKRFRKLLINYSDDLKKADNTSLIYHHANLLLEHKPEINGDFVVVLGEIIHVNPRFSVFKNADLLFTKAKKLNNSRNVLQNLITETSNKLQICEDHLNMIYSMDNETNIAGIYDYYGIKKTKKNKVQENALLPYFIHYKNTRILFGKNAAQNNYLSFKFAKKNTTFLHIKNISGSHIIIEEKNPSKELLIFAGNIALFLAKKSEAEVLYCPIANIKKGPHQGSVITKNEKVIFVRLEEKYLPLFKEQIKRVL